MKQHSQDLIPPEDHATTYEANETLVNERLIALYPAIAIETRKAKEFLPTSWNIDDRSKSLSISSDGLRVTHRSVDNSSKNPQNGSMASAVRANKPIPPICGIYYFEVAVQESPTGCLGIGVCQRGVQTSRLPGWDAYSYGYHGDDGHFFCSSGNGTQYGEKFGTKDIIGCGVNMVENHIFFTKNGVHQGIAMEGLELGQDLYPVIGMQSPHEKIDVNFGQVPFKFDIQNLMERTRRTVTEQLNEIDLPPFKKIDWFHSIIGNFLQTEGYTESFSAFRKYLANDPAEEPLSMIKTRKRIMDLITENQSAEASTIIKDTYPQMVNSDKPNRQQAMLLLNIQIYIEEARNFAYNVHNPSSPKSSRSSSHLGNGNSANYPSTSGISSSNSHKRSRSRQSDIDAPTKKVQPSRTSVAAHLNFDQPCSSKNGNSNGKSHDSSNNWPEHDDQNGMSSVHADPSIMGWSECGRDGFPYEWCSEQLLKLGQQISNDVYENKIADDFILAIVEEALPCIFYPKEKFRRFALFDKNYTAWVAGKVNDAIIECYHTVTSTAQPKGLTLSKILDIWKDKKKQMVARDCAAAVFMDDFEIIYGNESDSDYEDEDDEQILSEEDTEDESSDGSTNDSSEIDDSDEENESEETATSKECSSDEEMEIDQPTHSRAITIN